MARRRRRRAARVPKPFRIALAATLHDPTAALADDVGRALPALARLYAGVAVATSPPTSPRIVAMLREANAHAGTPPSNLRGPLYRLSVRAALRFETPRVHYLDFDRTTHWLRRAPRELAAVLRVGLGREALLIGRTRKAHDSHQRPLHATETLANRMFADALGFGGRVDFFVPSFVLTREGAARLLATSRARDVAIYGEWAALLGALAPETAYLECRGLDWETPDRHRRAVRRVGLVAWRRRFDTEAEWNLRTTMATEFVRGFRKTLERLPAERTRLVRLAQRVG